MDPQSGAVDIDKVELAHPDGTTNQFLFPEPARVELRTFPPQVTIAQQGGSVVDAAGDSSWSSVASKVLRSSDAQRASAISSARELGVATEALEVVEAALGGEKALEKLQWIRTSELKRFTLAANSMYAVGEAARHAKPAWSPPKSPHGTPLDLLVDV